MSSQVLRLGVVNQIGFPLEKHLGACQELGWASQVIWCYQVNGGYYARLPSDSESIKAETKKPTLLWATVSCHRPLHLQ